MPPPFNIVETKPASGDVISAFPADEQAARAEIEEWLTFISDPATGLINPSALPAQGTSIPSGTKAPWNQTAAPVGWTKDMTHNNKAFRIVSGAASSGGTVAFTTAFASQTPSGTIANTTATGTVAGTAISAAQMPSHTHTFTTDSAGSHSHTFHNGGNETSSGSDSGAQVATVTDATTSSSGSHSHSGTTAATGSGTTHTHGFTGTSHGHTFTGTAINLAVQYVDFIVATRD